MKYFAMDYATKENSSLKKTITDQIHSLQQNESRSQNLYILAILSIISQR